jgi:hypothetical protein
LGRKKVRVKENSKEMPERDEANVTRGVAQNRQEVHGTYRSPIAIWTNFDEQTLE